MFSHSYLTGFPKNKMLNKNCWTVCFFLNIAGSSLSKRSPQSFTQQSLKTEESKFLQDTCHAKSYTYSLVCWLLRSFLEFLHFAKLCFLWLSWSDSLKLIMEDANQKSLHRFKLVSPFWHIKEYSNFNHVLLWPVTHHLWCHQQQMKPHSWPGPLLHKI